MTYARDNVIAAVKTVFPDRDVTEILAVVDLYGTALQNPKWSAYGRRSWG